MNDADDMFANWVTDKEALRFWNWETHRDIDVTRSLLRQWISEYEKSDYYHWVIVSNADLQAIGYIYLDSVNESDRSAAVHYLLSRKYWNRCFMSEACNRVIEYAFCDVGFDRVFSYHHAENKASGRVMQKCGMSLIKSEYRHMDNERLSGEYHYYEIKKANDI